MAAKTKYTVDQKFKEFYIDLVGEENADFTVDKNGLLEDRDAFLAHASWEYKENQLKDYQDQIENLKLQNDCMINQVWFVKGSPVSELIKYAEGVYKAEVVAQNSKIEFGTDDNEIWWAHNVPYFGRVQLQRFVEHGIVEWDIHFNECWQGPFESKARAILHLEECIAEKREEAKSNSAALDDSNASDIDD